MASEHRAYRVKIPGKTDCTVRATLSLSATEVRAFENAAAGLGLSLLQLLQRSHYLLTIYVEGYTEEEGEDAPEPAKLPNPE